MWKLELGYDGTQLNDIYPLTDGFAFNVLRNGVGQISFSVSLRALRGWCDAQEFDIQEIFTPIKCTATATQIISDTESGVSVGGWLAKTPSFSFSAGADTQVNFVFVGWLGLTAGAFLIPPLSYNDNFNDVAHAQVTAVLERTFLAGAMWPITLGTSDLLPVVEGTLEAPKTLKDFLLERADNTTGTGNYDVYVDPFGVLALYERYGEDLSETIFSYPDEGGRTDIKQIDFPEWDNYISDIFLTGAGNGYSSTSGSEGAAIFSEARNTDTIANTGYWQMATSESDIAIQETLDDKATSYVKDTDKPFSVPSISLDGDRFKLYAHELGGNLWLGDTITVDASGWVKPLLPLETPIVLRINSVDVSVDKTGHADLKLGLVADV